MLRNLLNTHPDVMITLEFRNITYLGARLPRYASRVLWRNWNRDLVGLTSRAPRWRRAFDGASFVLAYALGILRNSRGGRVTLEAIRSTLHTVLPWAAVVGDKYPGYVYRLDRLAAQRELQPIVIYRDCRDVVLSTLEMARTTWSRRSFVGMIDTPRKVATRWAEAVTIQERNSSGILAIRYEELVTRPAPELERVASYLGIDPSGFRQDRLRADSIGRYRHSLTQADLAEIQDVAADAMRRLGYL